ncbi:Dihem cytochrome c [Sulfuricurvum kujiense DSM 16994]|uniref:Dihem cytochrome c n=1 Tax=Sulfuricurvum kujiense (strain ATCC BAA-921 / DSM 16994 / JCM 11577 / YK-1) TaxID=709032 RepID=E4TZB8_SULKY|nr:diheme cytochrome c [Sulfuricurvum kujiense]ADR34133.1 Dihem cytochrome c [Sulfuricurvum kujiense DSM 16994]
MMKFLNLSVAALILAGGVYLYAEDEHEEHEHRSSSVVAKPMTPQEKSTVALYQKECGSCHMAYQPQFLPKRSWDKTMNTLENHFGTDATLDPSDHKTIQNYLATHASKNDRTSDMKGAVALRISETPYFVREHREVTKKMVTQPEVKSFANCNACHTQASSGSYREREIRIPNYGRWED